MVPAVILISSPDLAISSSSLRVHDANSGTLRRWSTYAFLLAIGARLYEVRVTPLTMQRALPLPLVLDRFDGRRGSFRIEVLAARRHRSEVVVEVVAQRDPSGHVEADDV